MPDIRRITQAELLQLARERFGDDPKTYAFTCPNCGDTASIGEFIAAGADPGKAGQECIGRSLGALAGPPTKDAGRSQAQRGCDWTAYGLFPGPWTVLMPNDDGTEREVRAFPLAEAAATAGATS